MNTLKNIDIQEDNELQKTIEQIKKNYILFLIGIIVALFIAYLANKYMTPVYKVSATMLIRDNKNANQSSSQNGMIDLENLMASNKNFNNELLAFKSTNNIDQTIISLDLIVDYYTKSKFRFIDAYHDVPFKILYSQNHPQLTGAKIEVIRYQDSLLTINVDAELASVYDYSTNQVIKNLENYKVQLKGSIGHLIENENFSFIVKRDSTFNGAWEDKPYYFKFSNYDAVLQGYESAVVFKVVDIDATAIEYSIKSTSYKKGVDILNTLSKVYLNELLKRKNHIANITIDYIDKQLSEISDSLTTTERKLQNYRSSNSITNLTEQSTGISNQFRDLENKLADLVSHKKYYEYVVEYLNKNQNITNIVAPASMGIQDPILTSLMSEMITAQSEKNALIENKQEKNPYLHQLDIKIDNLKKTITQNIEYIVKTNDIAIDDLNKRISSIKYEINKLPKTERELLGIERKFKLNNEIYTYLLEKRAEANIMKASNLPDNEVIEPAKPVSNVPVSPNNKMNYAFALVFGFLVPFTYLRARSLMSNKIDRQEIVTRTTDFPIVGKILHSNKRINNIVALLPNSNIAESFRTLRTNLDFYVRGGQKRVILVTSSIQGEGKSFNALNIATSYSMYKRKTILLGFDLRKNSNYFSPNEGSLGGLTSYLIDKSNLEDIIINSGNENLDYIPAGPIPPNPIELIGLGKTENLFTQLKQRYDYIIIDTPPLGAVSDAYLLMKYADIKILLVRYNYTSRNVFSMVVKDLNHKQVESVCVLLNDNRAYNEQYGYGYYSGESKKKKWWKRKSKKA